MAILLWYYTKTQYVVLFKMLVTVWNLNLFQWIMHILWLKSWVCLAFWIGLSAWPGSIHTAHLETTGSLSSADRSSTHWFISFYKSQSPIFFLIQPLISSEKSWSTGKISTFSKFLSKKSLNAIFGNTYYPLFFMKWRAHFVVETTTDTLFWITHLLVVLLNKNCVLWRKSCYLSL